MEAIGFLCKIFYEEKKRPFHYTLPFLILLAIVYKVYLQNIWDF